MSRLDSAEPSIIQGTAANLLELALVRLHDTLPADVRMLLPVHHSALLEVPESLVEETRQVAVAAMGIGLGIWLRSGRALPPAKLSADRW